MQTDLLCECCKTPLVADFSNNVWCINKECLLYDKVYCYDYLLDRKEALENNKKPPTKELHPLFYANRNFQANED